MKSLTTWAWWVGSMALTVALGGVPGCGEMRPAVQAGVGEDEEVTTTRAALVPSEFWDGTGTIVIRVKPCEPVSSQPSGPVHNACAYCIMEPDWARVGGGAEISGEATPGAQLIASRPDRFIFALPDACPVGETLPPGQESDVWIAKSRGIVSHQVRAYAIGMKIKNANGALVKPEIDYVVDSSSGFAGSPAIASTTSVVVPGWITTGGGAEVIPPTANAYLIESAPVNTTNGVAWRARARYASGTPDGGVKTWVVAL